VSGRLFGTDGIRARFGEEPLVEGTVRRIGAALGAYLAARASRPSVLFGGDTRASSPELARWMEEGLARGGARAVDLGTLPTAAVARLVPARGAAAGVVLSASHNPAADNGIKLIAGDGFKWSDADEEALERAIRAQPAVAAGAREGRDADPSGRGDYLAALLGQLGGRPLEGMRVALDCAHGAASGLAAEVFEGLGAHVESLFDRPDGANINDGCGSLHPETLAAHVAAHGHDLGFAFDGDADRALLVDERGEVRDGDAMMVLWAGELAAAGELEPRAIVATSMSNLGLERALSHQRIEVVRCGVGDREVVATLRDRGLRLGGEQSGHIVDLVRSTTGDGLLTAAVLAAAVARGGRPVSERLAGFQRFPQRIDNVRVTRKPPLDSLPRVAAAAREVERRLGSEGRLVLRYSGTEPLARIMLEGPDAAELAALAAGLAAVIRDEIGA
jgi:phosphoglucosamine mutase